MRTRVAVLSIILIALIFAVTGCSAPVDTSFTVPRAQVKLLIGDNDNCSAVVLAPGKVLTARHCDEIVNPTIDGKPVKFGKISPDADLMLAEADVQCPCASVGPKPVLDEDVIVVGYPFANFLEGLQVLTQGKAQGVRHGGPLAEEGDTLIITAPVGDGNSGGGVFINREGVWYLVGILVMSNESTTLAVDLDTIKEFLK